MSIRYGGYDAALTGNATDDIPRIRVLLENGTRVAMGSMRLKRAPDLREDTPDQPRCPAATASSQEETMEDCIFCKIIRGDIPSFKVYEDEQVFAFEDINPISRGHTLVIPKNHAQDLWEIPVQDLTAVHAAAKKIASAIRKALSPSGVACLQLNGRGANQVVLHYHLHLIPRSGGEGELPVCNWELKQGDTEAIKKTAAEIAAAMK